MTQTKTATTGGTVRGGGRNGRYTNDNPSGSAAQLPIYADSGQFIGKPEGDTFIKRVKASRHMLRQPPAWALDASALRQLQAQGVTWVVYIDTETGKMYRTTVETFVSKGRAFNRGYGDQVFLSLGFWSINGAPPALVKREPDPNAGVQLVLFGGESSDNGPR